MLKTFPFCIMASLNVLLALCAFFALASCQKRGVQMRLTKKGMNYAVDVGMKIMEKDLKGKVINEAGKSGRIQYSLQNLRITKAEFKNYVLTPISGTGMKGSVSGISINAAGKVWYKYKRGWFKFSDTIGISMETKNIHFDMTVNIGADKDGRPTIAVRDCSAGVSDIHLDFHGGASWIYNLFSGLIEKKLKGAFSKLLCSNAIKEINTRARSELATFPVIKKLDKWAEIDYSLTANPTFTSNYMDAYLKGEFKAVTNPVESKLSVPTFETSSDHTRMVYFWLTDYTINTAGEVYHKTGRLSHTIAAWDKKMPSTVRDLLNTAKFGFFIPNLSTKYPNAPMALYVYSYQAPMVIVQSQKLTIHLYAHGMFKVKDKSSKIQNVFSVKFDITATATVGMREDNVTAQISTFDYNAQIDKSYVGKISIPLNSPFIKAILDMAVIKKANPLLQKGFPLPKIKEVSLENFDITLQKDVIRVGTDVRYVPDK